MDSLKDHIVFITGASSGIGEACAVEFAKHGAKLILAARREEKLSELTRTLQTQYKVNILPLVMDIRDYNQVEHAISTLPATFKNITILINNAGLAAGRATIQEADVEDWETMIDTNLKGLLYVTHAILPSMIERRLGHVINIGSTAGHQTYKGGSVYCATKSAVRAISSGLRKDLHGTPIRVTEVDPGLTKTEFSLVRFKQDKQQADQVYAAMTPLVAEDIADAVFYCATRKPHVNIAELVLYPTAQSDVQTVFRG